MNGNPLVELMRRGESGAAGYNAYNRGTFVDSHGLPHVRGADHPTDFAQLTVGQVQTKQHLPANHPERLFAVGKYQIIPDTLSGAVTAMNLSPDAPFTPQLQDRILFDYLIAQKRPAVHDYIVGKPGVTLQDAQHAMASEWASFGDPARGGRSHYAPPNHASITLEQSGEALNHMRDGYRSAIGRGLSPAQAWASATGESVAPTHVAPNAGARVAPREHATVPSSAIADGALTVGESGPQVQALQRSLDRLGYKDQHGRSIAPTGRFDETTLEAVKAFQLDHGLNGKGVFGPKTQAAMHEAGLALVTSPAHPHHALYEHTLEKVREAERGKGTAPGAHSERIAAALTTELIREGITRVDRVEFNNTNTLVRAVQVSPMRDESGLNRATDAISAPQASLQSVAESSRQMHEVAANMQARDRDPQFAQARPQVSLAH